MLAGVRSLYIVAAAVFAAASVPICEPVPAYADEAGCISQLRMTREAPLEMPMNLPNPIPLYVKVLMTVDRNDNVTMTQLVQSSGFHELDMSTIAAAHDSAWSMPPPNCPGPFYVLYEGGFPASGNMSPYADLPRPTFVAADSWTKEKPLDRLPGTSFGAWTTQGGDITLVGQLNSGSQTPASEVLNADLAAMQPDATTVQQSAFDVCFRSERAWRVDFAYMGPDKGKRLASMVLVPGITGVYTWLYTAPASSFDGGEFVAKATQFLCVQGATTTGEAEILP